MKTQSLIPVLLLACVECSYGVQAHALDPTAFDSLGTLNLTTGAYVVDTSGSAPHWLDAASNVVFTGEFYNQHVPASSNYWGWDPNVAVFDFDSVFVNTNVTITTVGPCPVAVLSRTGITLNGTLDGSAADGANATGNLGGTGDGSGGRGGSGGGKGGNGATGSPSVTKGDNGNGPGGGGGTGAYGGPGGLSTRGNGAGFGGRGGGGFGGLVTDSNYGDLSQYLQGGAGGGGTGTDLFLTTGAGGGGGGGGLELGALTSIALGGEVLANGGSAGGGGTALAGGGSGGGIFLHAPSIHFTTGKANLSAGGGNPNGGGGRLLILTASGQRVSGNYSVHHGASGGETGVLQFGTLNGSILDPNLVLSVQLVDQTNGLGARISWLTQTNTSYQLQATTDLNSPNWGTVGSTVTGNGTQQVIEVPINNTANQYYRVLVSP